jgi:VanZ family protein
MKLRAAALAYTLFLVAVVVGADEGKLRGLLALVDFVPGGDKAGHFVLMGTLAWLLNAALKRRRVVVWRRRVLLGSVITVLVVTFEEISQLHFATRHFDLLDLAADYAGILVFGWMHIPRMNPFPACATMSAVVEVKAFAKGGPARARR